MHVHTVQAMSQSGVRKHTHMDSDLWLTKLKHISDLYGQEDMLVYHLCPGESIAHKSTTGGRSTETLDRKHEDVFASAEHTARCVQWMSLVSWYNRLEENVRGSPRWGGQACP